MALPGVVVLSRVWMHNVGRLEKLLSLWHYCTRTKRVKTSFHEYNESDETTSQTVLTRYQFNNYAIFTLSTQPEQRSFESTMWALFVASNYVICLSVYRFLAFWTWSCGLVTAGSFTRRLLSTRIPTLQLQWRKEEPLGPSHITEGPWA